MQVDPETDRRLRRDVRVFMAGMTMELGNDRAMALANRVTDVASRLPGEPDSAAWFTAWAIVLREQATEAEQEAAARSMSNVKKLWDAGY